MPTQAVSTSQAPTDDALPSDISLWQRFSFTVVRTFLWGFASLFSLRGLYLFGRFFGTLEWLVNYKLRGRFRRRLKDVLGDHLTAGQRRRETWRYVTRTRCDKMFYLILDLVPEEKVLARFHYQGTELIDQALARGRGCFIALSHYGSNYLGGMLMTRSGYDVVGIRDLHGGGLRRFIQQLYERRHPEMRTLKVLNANAYPRDIYRCFQDNRLVGAALDAFRSRGEGKRTVQVDILGTKREVLVGTIQIALRCGAAVLQGFVISEKDFHYRLDVLGPLVPETATTDTPELLNQVMQAYANNIEEYVRRYPSHVSRT